MTRPKVAQRAEMGSGGRATAEEAAMNAFLFAYGQTKSAAISPLFSLLSRSDIIVSKPFLAAGVSLVNGGTGGCFL